MHLLKTTKYVVIVPFSEQIANAQGKLILEVLDFLAWAIPQTLPFNNRVNYPFTWAFQ